MGKDPDAIREEIARTREGMAGTVDALSYKTDVKERTKDKVRDVAGKPKAALMGIKDNVMGAVHEHTPDRSTVHDATDAINRAPGQVATQARRVGGVVRENPVGLALGGLALGFVAGLLLPNTRFEDEKLGAFSDQVKDAAKGTGQDLLDHGKDVAQTAVAAAQDAVQETGPDHAKDLAQSVRETATDLGGSAKETAAQVTS